MNDKTITSGFNAADKIHMTETALGELAKLPQISMFDPFAQILRPFRRHGQDEPSLGPTQDGAIGLQFIHGLISRLAIQLGHQATVGQQRPQPRQGCLIVIRFFRDH